MLIPWQGWSLPSADFVLTRTMEVLVHSDHHHLVCRECGKTVEVEGPAVELWAHKVSTEHGFSDVQHTLEIFGTCGSCAG